MSRRGDDGGHWVVIRLGLTSYRLHMGGGQNNRATVPSVRRSLCTARPLRCALPTSDGRQDRHLRGAAWSKPANQEPPCCGSVMFVFFTERQVVSDTTRALSSCLFALRVGRAMNEVQKRRGLCPVSVTSFCATRVSHLHLPSVGRHGGSFLSE